MKLGMASLGNRRRVPAIYVTSPKQMQKALLSQTRNEQSHGALRKSRQDKEIIRLNQEERVTTAGSKGKQPMSSQDESW